MATLLRCVGIDQAVHGNDWKAVPSPGPTCSIGCVRNEGGAVPQVMYTEDDNGREIHVRKGDLVTLALPENPTTGHLWQIAPGASEGSLPQEVHFSPGDATAPGSAGTRTFAFQMRAPGRATLELHLRRPWRAAAPPTRRFLLVVHVS
ncbi:protease inhibitor I42 family protein [Streptomyces sp. NPDC102406]|uniref:protease inhibitor I42 family protein n=1 Tax=Streptomyces sp. NPDC102406 TaxID=3366171 RepID=UPI00380FE156